MTARKEECKRLEPMVDETVRKEGALKPVSPKEDPIEREGLSQNGEAAEVQEELEVEDTSSQEGDEVQEGRTSGAKTAKRTDEGRKRGA